MSAQTSALQQQRQVIDQLRREVGTERIRVSVAIEGLKKYIEDHKNEDYLLVGFGSQRNPFLPPRSCVLI